MKLHRAWLVVLFMLALALPLRAQSGEPSPAASLPSPSAHPSSRPAAPFPIPLTAPTPASSPSPSPTPTPAAPSSAPSGAPASANLAIPLPMVVDKAAALQTVIEHIEGDISADADVAAIEQQVREMRVELHQFGIRLDKALAEDPSLDSVQGLSSDLYALWEPSASWAKILFAHINMMEGYQKTLNLQHVTWKLTAQSAEEQDAPPELRSKIDEMLKLIRVEAEKVDLKMREVLALQGQLGEMKSMYVDLREHLTQASATAATLLLKPDSPPLWTAGPYLSVGGVAQASAAVAQRAQSVRRYLAAHPTAQMAHLCLVLLLFLFVLAVGRAFHAWDSAALAMQRGAITRTPLAAAYVTSIFAFASLYPAPPRFFTLLMVISVVLSAIIVIRPLVDPRLRVTLLALGATCMLDAARGAMVADVSIFRMILALEQLLGIVFMVWLCFVSGRLAEARDRTPRAVRYTWLTSWYALLGFVTSFVANVAGYANLSRYIMNLTVGPVYVVVVLLCSLRIIDTYLQFFLRARPLGDLGAVRRNRERLRSVLRIVLLVLGMGLWVRYFVSQTPLENLLATRTTNLLNVDLGLGGATPGGILLFIVVVASSFVVSRVILALLEEDVYPRVPLPSGLPYAISTILHYTLLLLGFLIALSALGLDMTRFTVMVSAFGVGLGFGLQTIVNNLVSGVILLFERPVKIGDVIEMGSNRGQLTHIGLRASVLHASDGSDIILPNGTLLSSNVVNYTFADPHRRLDIEVQIPSGHHAEKIMSRLVERVRGVEGVMQKPAPECHFVKFNDKQLILQVRAWVDSTGDWRRTRSALNLAVYGMLLEDGLVAALPAPAEG